MKIRVLSDIHLNINKEELSWKPDDILTLIAGDVSPDIKQSENWIRKNFKKVIFVEGNHILYPEDSEPIEKIYELHRKVFPKNDDIAFLQDEYKIIDDVVFIGSTLWADYSYCPESHVNYDRFLKISKQMINGKTIDEDGNIKKVTMETFSLLFNKSLKCILETCKAFPDKKIVLVTHFPPSEKSIHPKFKNYWANFSVISDIEKEIINIPNLCLVVHGHVHQSHDYMLNDKIRVICNPLGINENGIPENPEFIKDLIIEI